MEFIKEQSQDKQIIISTHSPIVLDVLSPDELNRINIVKLTNEGTQCYKLNEEQVATAQRYMSEVGDLSYYWLHSDLENE
jgi:predicted ATPase